MKMRLDLSKVQGTSTQDELQQISKITDDEWTFRLKQNSERGLTWNEHLNSIMQNRVNNIHNLFTSIDFALIGFKKKEQALVNSYNSENDTGSKTPTPMLQKPQMIRKSSSLQKASSPKYQIQKMSRFQSSILVNPSFPKQSKQPIDKGKQNNKVQKYKSSPQYTSPFALSLPTASKANKNEKVHNGHISTLQNGIKRSEFLLTKISEQSLKRIKQRNSLNNQTSNQEPERN